ncbi:MAG: AAA family ATPase [Dehalogenimonas sp.]
MITPNVTVIVAGEAGTGKTHFACTAPQPILLQSFDLGAEVVLAKNFPDAKIELKKYALPLVSNPTSIVRGSQKVWEEFFKDFLEALKSNAYKSIVLDTNTALWELCRMAYQEETNLTKIAPLKYVEPNARMRSLFQQAQLSGVNLVSVHHLKDVYVDNQVAGKGLAGWSESERFADFVLMTDKIRTVDKGRRKTVMTYKFEKSRWERDIEGEVMNDLCFGDMITMAGLDGE